MRDEQTISDKPQVDMPRYRSHKEVSALEIASFERFENSDDYLMTFADTAFPSRGVAAVVVARYKPVKGDFFVVYADGYDFFSPRKAFLEGYTPVAVATNASDEAGLAEQDLHDFGVIDAITRPPVTFQYRGLSYKQASRAAQAICRAAGRTGQTNAAKHLAELHAVMELAQSGQE